MKGMLPIVLLSRASSMLVAMGMSLGTFVDRDFEKRFHLKPQRRRTARWRRSAQPRRVSVLLWLALRQGSILAGVLLVLGFLLGLALPAAGAGLWPAATLFLGVACGLAVFSGEQAEGAFKFWGDQRLPVGWLWLRRSVACGLGIGMIVAGLMLLGRPDPRGRRRGGLPSDRCAALRQAARA